jgi:hypothetical protein
MASRCPPQTPPVIIDQVTAPALAHACQIDPYCAPYDRQLTSAIGKADVRDRITGRPVSTPTEVIRGVGAVRLLRPHQE